MLKHCLINPSIPNTIKPEANALTNFIVKKRHLADMLPYHEYIPVKRQRSQFFDIFSSNMSEVIKSSMLENAKKSTSWGTLKFRQNHTFLTALSQTSTQPTTPASSDNNFSQNFLLQKTISHNILNSNGKSETQQKETNCDSKSHAGQKQNHEHANLFNQLKDVSTWNRPTETSGKKQNESRSHLLPISLAEKTTNLYSDEKISNHALSNTTASNHVVSNNAISIGTQEKMDFEGTFTKTSRSLFKPCESRRNILTNKTVLSKKDVSDMNTLKMKPSSIIHQQTLSNFLMKKPSQQKFVSYKEKLVSSDTDYGFTKEGFNHQPFSNLQEMSSLCKNSVAQNVGHNVEKKCQTTNSIGEEEKKLLLEAKTTVQKKEKKCTDCWVQTEAAATLNKKLIMNSKSDNGNTSAVTSQRLLSSEDINCDENKVSDEFKSLEKKNEQILEMKNRDNNLMEGISFENPAEVSSSEFKDDEESGYIITPGQHRICINTFLMQADWKLQQLVCETHPGLASISNYGQDIYTKWRETELKVNTQSHQLSFKPGTNIEKFRRTSIYFILQQVYDWGLSSSTAHVSISNINRVLLHYIQSEVTSVLTANMFINTVFACLRMAIKHEETPEKIRPMRIISTSMCKLLGIKENDPHIMLDNITTNVTEQKCLKILSDPAIIASAPEFLARYLLIGSWPEYLSKMYYELALYLVNLALFSRKDIDQLSGIPPSIVAAGALSLAIRVISSGRNDAYECWPQRLVVYTGYGPLELKQAVRGLSALLRTKPEGSEVLEKFHPLWASFDWK